MNISGFRISADADSGMTERKQFQVESQVVPLCGERSADSGMTAKEVKITEWSVDAKAASCEKHI